MLLLSISIVLGLLSSNVQAKPLPFPAPVPIPLALAKPDHPWSAGSCKPPDLEVNSVEKFRSGPKLVSGARTRANPGGGEYCSPMRVTCALHELRKGDG